MADPNRLILANIISDKLAQTPDLDVLTFVDILPSGAFREEIRTYRDLWSNGQRVAEALMEAGQKPGKAFALMMANHPEFVDVMVGASISNTVMVPIDPRTKGDKLKYMISFAECRGVIIADYSLPLLLEKGVLDSLPELAWVWVLETGAKQALPADKRFHWLRKVLDRPVPNLPIAAEDPLEPMQMLFTSGTTGDPKAILAPHARFGSIASIGPLIGLTPQDRPYTGLSLTHANAQLITLGNVIRMGLRGVIGCKFTKSRLWDITRHYGCTMFNLLGGMTTAIYSEPVKPNDGDNPVRYVLSAGMPKAIWENFQKRFNVDIFEFYGTAEGGLTMNTPGQGGPIGSIGKAPPTMICTVRNDDDEECAPFESGEICFQNADGSVPAFRYFKNDKATADKLREGWFRTGDIGHKDAEGWLFFEYRKGTAIRRNGDFIAPAFVEKALAEHPDVNDVYVYGIPTPENAPGEKEVVAAVVPVDPASFDPQALFAHARKVLERNFVPTFIQVLDEIPKTASEKPQDRFLIEAFQREPHRVFKAL